MNSSSKVCLVVLLVTLSTACGCAKHEEPSESQQGETTAETTEPVDTLSPQERALEAKQAMFGRLSSALLTAMGNGGPSAAIEVCGAKASKIAVDVGREHGLKIGRTSFKLRNPENQPPEWAVHLVEQRVTEPQFVELENQTMAALLPIRLSAQCIACHGPKDQLAEDVRQALAQRYPDDQATGFQAGDLRGWFWVEVPASAGAVQ